MSTAITGWSHSAFGRLDGVDLESLICQVSKEAIADAGIDARDIDAIWLGHFGSGLIQENFCASLVMQGDDALRWKPATRVENACASGSAALYAALDAVESGRVRMALVVGAEKMTSVAGKAVTQILANASYVSQEAAMGLTFPGVFATVAQQYFDRYGDHSDILAEIAAKNHANSTRNPYAHMRKDLGYDFCRTVSDKNPLIEAPLRMTDCSLVTDGAAAVVVTNTDTARAMKKAVAIRARVQVNDFLPMARRDVIQFEGPRRAWQQALKTANCCVQDLSFAEVHDCFTIAELLVYEAMGLAESGEGARVVKEGLVQFNGALPVNPSGGLKAKGHPIGATGVSMHALAAMQLTDGAGDMQIPKPQLAGILNMGGMAVANYVSVLERIV